MIKTLTVHKDGSKEMEFDGVRFWVNPYGLVLKADNWFVCDWMVRAGLVYRRFCKNNFGDVYYVMVVDK